MMTLRCGPSLPEPLGPSCLAGATEPVTRYRTSIRTAVEGATSKRAAIAWRD